MLGQYFRCTRLQMLCGLVHEIRFPSHSFPHQWCFALDQLILTVPTF